MESGRRSGGCTVPVPEGSTWLSPSSVTGDSWGDSSWRWGPVPPKGVEDRTGLGWLCLDGSANVTPFCLPLELQLSRRAPKASFWMAQEPPLPAPSHHLYLADGQRSFAGLPCGSVFGFGCLPVEGKLLSSKACLPSLG